MPLFHEMLEDVLEERILTIGNRNNLILRYGMGWVLQLDVLRNDGDGNAMQ